VSWFALFLLLFALGTAASVVPVAGRGLGKYYFKFHATVALLMAAAAVAAGRPWAGLGAAAPEVRVGSIGALVFAAVVLAVNAVVRAGSGEPRREALLLPVTIGTIFVVTTVFARRDAGIGESALLAAQLLTSAGALGTSLTAMSTGHWYLANAALSFGILIRLCRFLIAALSVRAVFAAVYGLGRMSDYARLEDFDLLILATRVLAGIVLALVLAFMALSCAKRKANQSATGILYVAVVFVLIGETISAYLTLAKDRPI
jgi:hypothetical protein